jgi:arylsulfatase A-like enzyme
MPDTPKPNIIVILADDLGFGDVGCYGATKIQTPQIDRLAQTGMRFIDAHTSSQICCPSRYALLTGRHYWRSEKAMKGFETRHAHGSMSEMLERERLTMAKMLKNAGYNTGMVGKWHLGLTWQTKEGKKADKFCENLDYTKPFEGGPLTHGFDYFYGIAGSAGAPPYCFLENNYAKMPPSVFLYEGDKNTVFLAKGMMGKGWQHNKMGLTFAEKSVQFIEKQAIKKQPFFLYLAATQPHTPHITTLKFKGKSQAGAYGDMVAELDWTVGKIVETLKKQGIYDNTLIILTSDNGGITTGVTTWATDPTRYEIEDYGHKQNGFLRGQKGDLWEGGHRVPFIAFWKNKIAPNQTSSQMLCLTDLLATFATITGQGLPDDAGEDSFNILSLFTEGGNAKPVRHTLIHYADHDSCFAFRQDNMKLINCQNSGGFMSPYMPENPKRPKGQLYNIQFDLTESENLYDAKPDAVKAMEAVLKKEIEQGYTRPKN